MVSLNLFHYFLLLVLGQGVFLTIILFTLRKGDHIANRFLAAAVFLMTYYTFSFFLNDSGYKAQVGTLFLSGYSIVPLIPVTIYFYLKRTSDRKPVRNFLPHLIPFLIQFLYWLPHNTDGFYGSIYLDTVHEYYPYAVVRVGSGMHIILFTAYVYACFKTIDFQNATKKREKWMKKIRSLFTILAFIFTIGTFSLWMTDIVIARHIFFSFLAFFIYLIGYYGYTRSDIVFEMVKRLKPKYYSSKLSPERSMEIYDALQHLMLSEKLYLQSTIKLPEVASKLEVGHHDLSRVVNENYGGSFLDFINKYRVDEAKHILMAEKEPPKMFAVALDSGFGNKVSFYKNFKKFTGSLPSDFVKSSYKSSLG